MEIKKIFILLLFPLLTFNSLKAFEEGKLLFNIDSQKIGKIISLNSNQKPFHLQIDYSTKIVNISLQDELSSLCYQVNSIDNLKVNDKVFIDTGKFNTSPFKKKYPNLPTHAIYYVKDLYSNGKQHFAHISISLFEYLSLGDFLIPEYILGYPEIVVGLLYIRYIFSYGHNKKPKSKIFMRSSAVIEYDHLVKIKPHNSTPKKNEKIIN